MARLLPARDRKQCSEPYIFQHHLSEPTPTLLQDNELLLYGFLKRITWHPGAAAEVGEAPCGVFCGLRHQVWEGFFHSFSVRREVLYNTVTCIGVRVTRMTGSSSDDWIY
jgi:hypothetical protein